MQFYLEYIACGSLIYEIDHSKFSVSNQMDEFISMFMKG